MENTNLENYVAESVMGVSPNEMQEEVKRGGEYMLSLAHHLHKMQADKVSEEFTVGRDQYRVTVEWIGATQPSSFN